MLGTLETIIGNLIRALRGSGSDRGKVEFHNHPHFRGWCVRIFLSTHARCLERTSKRPVNLKVFSKN